MNTMYEDACDYLKATIKADRSIASIQEMELQTFRNGFSQCIAKVEMLNGRKTEVRSPVMMVRGIKFRGING